MVRAVLGIACAVCAIVLFGVGLHIFENMDRDTGFDEPEQEDSQSLWFDDSEYEIPHNIESYLLIGTDDSGNEDAVGTGYYEGRMADFLLLIIMDKTDNTYGFLQLDRNTMTDVIAIDRDGKENDTVHYQICTAHAFGKDPQQGCENTVQSVTWLLGGLPIDGYYAINMSDIGALNHAVGGVEVTPQEDLTMVDPAMQEGTALTLTDEQAEKFIRARMNVGNGTNEERMDRQLQYMTGFKRKLSEKMDADGDFLNSLYEDLTDRAMTDIPQNRVSAIANHIYKSDDLGIIRLDGKHTEGRALPDGQMHDEFYPETSSIIEAMKTLCHVKKVTDTEED